MKWRIESLGQIVKVGAVDRAIGSVASPPDGDWKDSPAFYTFPADDRPPRLTRGLAACPGSITRWPLLQDGGELEDLHVKLEIIFSYWLSVEQDNSPDYHEEMNRETVRFWLQDVAERGAFCERFGIDLSSYLGRIDWVRIEESDHPLDEVAYSEVVNKVHGG
jgi:hypothetical protein